MQTRTSLACLACFFTVLLISSCATSRKLTFSPVGTWNYTVINTPDGNVSGQMIITREGEDYAGHIQSDGEVIPMEDLSLEGKELTSTLMVEGDRIVLKGTFERDTFSGEVQAENNTYDITAIRSAQ